MTEQEKHDNLVLEMAQQLCEYAGMGCQDCPKSHSPEEYGKCELPEICNTLADYMLHKEKEAQKETAREIIYGIVNLTHIIELDEEVEEHIYSHLFDECKKYGLNEQEFIDRII